MSNIQDDVYASASYAATESISKLDLDDGPLEPGLENTAPSFRRSSTASGTSDARGVKSSDLGKENLRSESIGPSTTTHGGSVWLEQGRRGRSNYSGVGVPYTGYDSQGLAHSKFRAPSTTASEQSWGAVASTGSSLRSSQVELTKSGFAKTRVSVRS